MLFIYVQILWQQLVVDLNYFLSRSLHEEVFLLFFCLFIYAVICPLRLFLWTSSLSVTLMVVIKLFNYFHLLLALLPCLLPNDGKHDRSSNSIHLWWTRIFYKQGN